MTDYQWEIREPFVWVDQTLQTASWWDEYVVLPGTYDIEHRAPGMAVVKVEVVRTREYRVNRLLHHRTADLKVVNRMTTYTFQMYDYEVTETHSNGTPTILGPRVFAGPETASIIRPKITEEVTA